MFTLKDKKIFKRKRNGGIAESGYALKKHCDNTRLTAGNI